MLTIKNLTKHYKGSNKGVTDINLSIEPGDIYAFIGHNGAGKTTTLKCVVGIHGFEQGEILINGINIEKFDRNILQKYIAPVFQDTVHYSISVEENITFNNNPNSEKVDKILKFNLSW